MTTTCGCTVNYDIPAVTAVCGLHALKVTHTPRDGYTQPCPACSDHRDGELADVGSGTGPMGRECKTCRGRGRIGVTLIAAKAAIRWVQNDLPEFAESKSSLLLSGRIGRAPRRRRR